MAEPTSTTFKQFKADQERLGANPAEIQTQWDALTRSGRPTTVDLIPPTPAPAAATTPSLYGLSADLMGQSSLLSESRARRMETTAGSIEKEAAELAQKAREQEAERTAAQPQAPDLTKPPSTKARAFLEPGDSVLGQIQTVMQGIGQLALGLAGTKGRGYAIAATAALKGAAEGWQQGDAIRVERSMADWQASHSQLMDQYQLERDAFNDLLTNQKISMSERFAQLRMRAEVMGLKDLADQARQENLAGVMNYLQTIDASALKHEEVAAKILQWKSESEHRIFNEAATKERLALSKESGDRSERRTRLAEEFGGNVMKAQQAEIGLRNQITNVGIVRDAIDILDAKGVLPKGTTFLDKMQVALALQTHPGDQELLKAVETLRRLGTPLLVKTEMSLGMTGQVMRIKSMTEAEAGNILGVPKGFWDMFLPKVEAQYREQLTMTQEHLRHLNLLRQGPQEDVILETTP